MTAMLPIALDKRLQPEELGELLSASEEERQPAEDFIIDAVREKLATRRAMKRTKPEPAPTAA